MFLAGLFALGAGPKAVEAEVAKLPGLESFSLVVGKVKRQGISAWRARVQCPAKARARDLGTILEMIATSPLDDKVKALSSNIFRALGTVEGKIHGVPADKVHFHEVGAVDSIVDIVGAAVALAHLGFPRLYHRPFRLGSGTVATSHGLLPVPAPATLELLSGCTVRLTDEEAEIVTPTGAALMKALAKELPTSLSIRPQRIVYSVGTREEEQNPGLLRMIALETGVTEREVVVIRTTIDDMTPEAYGFLQERLFEEGALEVYLTQLIMKKGRPGVLVTILCESAAKDTIVGLLFRETTTLGVRLSIEDREELERWTEQVDTPLGKVQVKRGRLPDGTVKTSPEYESCRSIARDKDLPFVEVFRTVAEFSERAARRGTKAKRSGEREARRGAKRKRATKRKARRAAR
jgi:uncharacterized protein (TIGR00299 family) protein